MLIKICGVCSLDVAKESVIAGANLIGLVFHPASPRFISCELASEIANCVIENGATPVAIFVDHSAEQMREICEETQISMVQLNSDLSRAQHRLLPDHYQRIYVRSVSDNGELQNNREIKSLFPERDFIQIDHLDPGFGKTFNWNNFHYDLPFRWLLAGGLNSSNVKNAIDILQPDGVDVSSGVEIERGKKDIKLVKEFISKIRQ